jgi:fatty acid desaturase
MRDVPRELRRELAALRARDDRRNVVAILSDWLAVAVAIAASIVTANPFVYVAAVIVIGSRQRALMNLVHEASHHKLFTRRGVNHWAGKLLIAFPVITGLAAYTCSHCRHHARLWDEERDPKTLRYLELDLVEPAADRSFWVKHLARPLALVHVPRNVAASLSWEGEPRAERLQRLAYWVVVLAVVGLLGLWTQLVLFWVLPYCTTFQVVRYWAEMAEHAGLRSSDPWQATRNWTSNGLVRWLMLSHDQYHLVHHLFPGIPHYRTPAAHRLLMQVPEYAAAHHCDGFFWPHRADTPSVLQDIRHPSGVPVRRPVRRRDTAPVPAAG